MRDPGEIDLSSIKDILERTSLLQSRYLGENEPSSIKISTRKKLKIN